MLGVGWLFSAVPDGAPTRQMLDEIVADRPVYLNANDLHSVWANTAALAELGITDATPNPIGGEIVRDAAGVATGLLMENAGYHLAWPVMNRGTEADHDRELDAAIQAYLAAGTTSAVEMALDKDGLDAMLRAVARGTLPFTVHAHWLVSRTGDPATELAQVARAAELARRHADGPVRVVGIKLISWYQGYPDDGPLLDTICAYAHEHGMPILNHSWGPKLGEWLARYPRAQFICGHWDPARAELARRHENLWICTCLPIGHESFERGLRDLRPDRVMWGSDMSDLQFGCGLGPILLSRVSDEVKRRVIGLNMLELLETCGIPAPPAWEGC